jgi:HD-GYP domain-containing protein (c-di-GMP phosphodiesterase class II)
MARDNPIQLPDDAKLRRYLLGLSPPEESEEIELAILGGVDPIFEVVEDELIEDYITGELNETDRSHFERRLLRSHAIAEKVRLSAMLLGRRAPDHTYLESLVKARTDQLQAAMADLERCYQTDLKSADVELKLWASVNYDRRLADLAADLGLYDRESAGRRERVDLFTSAIAKAMDLPTGQIITIDRGALLHDIGKKAIPDSILNKPGKLEPDEMAIVKEHAHRWYLILKKIPFLAEAGEIMYSYQECFDGSGYPRGLKGEQIPLGARIFSLAVTLDAITSDRSYGPAQRYQAAREEIAKWAGRHFDPEVVKVFLDMPDRIWDKLRKKIDAHLDRVEHSAGANVNSSREGGSR